MDALTKLRQRNRRYATLKSGVTVAYHLADVKLCIVESEELDASALRKVWYLSHAIVAHMLEALEGEEITDRDDRFAIAAAFDPEDRAELAALGAPEPVKQVEAPQDWEDAAAENERLWLASAK